MIADQLLLPVDEIPKTDSSLRSRIVTSARVRAGSPSGCGRPSRTVSRSAVRRVVEADRRLVAPSSISVNGSAGSRERVLEPLVERAGAREQRHRATGTRREPRLHGSRGDDAVRCTPHGCVQVCAGCLLTMTVDALKFRGRSRSAMMSFAMSAGRRRRARRAHAADHRSIGTVVSMTPARRTPRRRRSTGSPVVDHWRWVTWRAAPKRDARLVEILKKPGAPSVSRTRSAVENTMSSDSPHEIDARHGAPSDPSCSDIELVDAVRCA